MATEKAEKPKKVRLDLVHDAEKFIAIVRKECTTLQYDKRKIEQKLNCRGGQADTLITLAQLADAQQPTKAAK